MQLLGVAVLSLASTLSTAQADDVTPTVACFDPARYGAKPNDGVDDRDAIQQAVDDAIEAHGTVCIGAGNYDIARRPGTGPTNIPSIRVYGAQGLTIRGVGAATRLRMLGSGRGANWRLIDIAEGSRQVTVRDLWLDGTQRTESSEQTHLLQLTGPVSDVTVERVWFDHPRLPGMVGGDCVRLLGNAGATVENVVLRGLTGLTCDRSFVAVQRGVHGVLLEGSTSLVVGDQAIDFEPSGDLGVSDFEILDNYFARGPQAEGDTTVVISGDGAAVAERIHFAQNVMVDGGIQILDAHDVTLEGVFAMARPDSAVPPLFVRKRIEGLRVVGSTFVRPAGPVASHVVAVNHQGEAAPSDVTFENCVFDQGTSMPIMSLMSLGSLAVRGSTFRYAGTPGPNMAITGRGIIAAIAQVTLEHNRFEGPLLGALRLNQYSPSFPTGSVVVTDNAASGLGAYGVALEAGKPTVAPVVERNEFGAVPPLVLRP